MSRTFALAVLGILLLTAGAMFLVYRLTEPEGPRAEAVARPAEEPSAAGAPPQATADGFLVPSPPQLAPGVIVETGPPPPPMPANREARSDALIELREQRRGGAFEQRNAREAARRARLGLPPAPPPQQPGNAPQRPVPSGERR